MSGPAHRSVSNIRPSIQGTRVPSSGPPGSPHTPVRTISSNYGSPSSLRAEEDCVVIEIGNRYVRAGFAGDSLPKALVGFGPEEQRRAGDYRQWRIGYDAEWRERVAGKKWGENHELWKLDIRSVDLGLVSDKIERAVREAFTKYLLLDSRPRRLALVLPSILPLPILSTLLDTLFNSFQAPTISLMSAPLMATVASGLRAALVIDIGWAETIVTGIYEYREVLCKRTVRASQLLIREMSKMLGNAARPLPPQQDKPTTIRDERNCQDIISFEECEEVTARMAWCRSSRQAKSSSTEKGLSSVQEEDESESIIEALHISSNGAGLASIPLSSIQPPMTLNLPFSRLAEPCEVTFFAEGIDHQQLDDEELPLQLLVYRSLMCLPVDIRSACMSRLVFTGGASKIPGLKKRILDDVDALIQSRGWDPVSGKAVKDLRNNLNRNKQANSGPTEVYSDNPLPQSAANEDQEFDPIEDQLRRESQRSTRPYVQGSLRAVESMGAWSGASLLSQLKIPAVAIVEREPWLQHGPAGSLKPGEAVVAKQRQSMGPAGLRAAAGEQTGWSLGQWG